MAKDIIRMSRKELKRLHIIRKILEGGLKQTEAAGVLSLSERQIRRIVKRVRDEGDGGIAHKSRGRASGRRFAAEIKERVINLYRDQYHDFGPTLVSEKLFERDGIKLSDETLRNWLIDSGDWHKERRKRTHRQWRERKHYFGEMLQMDGSEHDWLEGRGPKLVLMVCIDDATNNVFSRFYDYEGTIPAMDCFKRYIKRYGLPQSVYLDKHTTYKSPRQLTLEEELEGVTEPLSEFGRALQEIGVERIHANSPQAKGRVERVNRTLQDRLVKEMRLRGIRTKDDANRFLEGGYIAGHNKRFSVLPAKEADVHRRLPEGFDLDGALCIKTERVLRNDFTVAHEGKLYQILDCVNAKKVMVEERTDGRMFIKYNNKDLRFKEILVRPEKAKRPITYKQRKKHIPPKDHPWRKYPVQLQKEDISNLPKTGHF